MPHDLFPGISGVFPLPGYGQTPFHAVNQRSFVLFDFVIAKIQVFQHFLVPSPYHGENMRIFYALIPVDLTKKPSISFFPPSVKLGLHNKQFSVKIQKFVEIRGKHK